MGVLLPILLLVAYDLPDLDKIPAPDAPHASRIEKALATIRTGEGAEVDVAVRDLALCGECALGAIVRRLGEAPAGERLLLLAAASPMARAAPLLEQARNDEHPAVRAWAGPARREKDPPLRKLAEAYLDALAVAEQRLYGWAGEDLAPLEDRIEHREDSIEVRRRRFREDKELQGLLRRERSRSATRFARAGALALERGEMKPDLKDPVFVLYTGLLREEDGDAAYFATVALVKAGAKAAPALEVLLGRESHDPKKIVRILCVIRPDGWRGLYDGFVVRRPEVQHALVDVAPDVLEGAVLVAFLEQAALEGDESVRIAALDALLDLPAPAGREPARTLLDPERFGPGEYKRAAELLARCGEVEPLETFAALPPAPPGPSGDSPNISNLRAAAQTALRGASGDTVEAMGRRFLEAESKGVRTLGIDLVRDRETLIARARAEPGDDLARAAVLRLLALHPDAAETAVEILHARGLEVETPVLQLLLRAGRVDLVVALAATESDALHILPNLPSIDARHEAALLAILDRVAAAGRRDALGAVVALGTEQARLRCEAADPDLALEVLAQRARSGLPIGFAFPLGRFVAGAGATRLKLLADVAEGLPSVERGFFFDLFRAWGGVEGPGTGEGPAQERALLFDGIARTDDAVSAKLFFDLLVAGETEDPAVAMGTLMVAAKHLTNEELTRFLPLLRAQVAEERPRTGARPPPSSGLRRELLRGGCNMLGFARVEAALGDLCDIVLDPTLQPAAFEWPRPGEESYAPYWALDALRDFPAATVDAAFRRALARAEADGRLAACDPGDLDGLVFICRNGIGDEWWTRGRGLHEVALALCDAIERMPGADMSSDRMTALGGLGRYPEAAAAARVAAERRRARGFTALNGFGTPEYFEARARLYEGLAARDGAAIFAAAEAADEPFVWNLAAWYLCFEVPDAVPLAARAGETAVRESAGLQRLYRDWLAAVRNAQGRPRDSLRLLDPLDRVPVRRRAGNLWHEAFFADAYLQLGEETAARHALDRASRDRRVLPWLRRNPAFARFEDVFRDADESFFYDVLFARQWE